MCGALRRGDDIYAGSGHVERRASTRQCERAGARGDVAGIQGCGVDGPDTTRRHHPEINRVLRGRVDVGPVVDQRAGHDSAGRVDAKIRIHLQHHFGEELAIPVRLHPECMAEIKVTVSAETPE